MTEHVRLEDCPSGLFVFENGTYLKTVFNEAFDCRDGSHFWGHPEIYVGCRKMTKLMSDRCDIMVRPVT